MENLASYSLDKKPSSCSLETTSDNSADLRSQGKSRMNPESFIGCARTFVYDTVLEIVK